MENNSREQLRKLSGMPTDKESISDANVEDLLKLFGASSDKDSFSDADVEEIRKISMGTAHRLPSYADDGSNPAFYAKENTKNRLQYEIDEQIANLNKISDANKDRWFKEMRKPSRRFGASGLAAGSIRIPMPDELMQVEAADLELRKARKTLDTYTVQDDLEDEKSGHGKGFFEKAYKGFTNASFEDVANIATGMGASTLKNESLNQALQKASQGEPLTEIEQAMIVSRKTTQDAEQYVADRGGATKSTLVGSAVLNTVPYAVETATSGGSLNVTKMIFKGAAKKAIAKELGKVAVKEGARTMVRGSLHSNFQDATSSQYSVDDENNVSKQEIPLAERLWKSYATTYAEGLSEQFGNVVGRGFIGRGFKKATPWLLGKQIGGTIVDGVDVLSSKFRKPNEFMQKVFNFNGGVDEYAEEQVNDILDPLLTGELERLKDLFDKNKQLVKLGSVFMMSGTTHVLSYPSIVQDEIKGGSMRRDRNKSISAIADEDIRQGVYDAVKQGQTVEERANMFSAIDWSKATPSDAANGIDAFTRSINYDLYKGFDESKQSEKLAALKAKEYSDVFKQLANKDDGMVHLLADDRGNQYYLLEGSLDDQSVDGMSFVRNATSGLTELVQSHLLTTLEKSSYTQGLDALFGELSVNVESEQQMSRMAQDKEDAAEVGVKHGNYKRGQMVQLSDGRTAEYFVDNGDGVGAQVRFYDAETDEYIPEDVAVDKIVGLAPTADETTEVSDNQVTAEPITATVEDISSDAVSMPNIELTEQAWNDTFGTENTIQTPIGVVKMGENQMKKLLLNNREGQFGMVVQTLKDPTVIIDESRDDKNAAVFVKSFFNEKDKLRYYSNIVVDKEGQIINISSHHLREPQVKEKIEKGKLLYKTTRLNTSDQASLEQSPEVAGVSTLSEDKATNSVPQTQVPKKIIPLLKDGSPDYDSMPADMYLEEYSKISSREDALADIRDEHADIEDEIRKLEAKKTLKRNEKIKNRAKIVELRTKADDIASVLAQNEPAKADPQPSYSVGENVRQQYTEAPKEYGVQKSIIAPNDESIPGRYVLLESGAVTASHNAQTFVQSEGFPVTESGSTVNDRDYGKDKQAQQQVISIAQRYNGRAIDNPVVVTPDGVVISGNNRTMSGELAAKSGTDKAYLQHLTENAAQYGFTAEQVAQFKNPRIVFETAAPQPYNTETFSKFNAQETKTQNKVEKAIKIGKTIGDKTVRRVSSIVDEYETLGELYGTPTAVNQVIKTLQDAGVINQNEVAELKDGDYLSGTGKDMVETMLVGSVLSEDAVRLINSDGMKRYRQRITKAILPILDNSTLGDYSIADQVSEAVTLLDRARQRKSSIDDTLSMKDMFEQTEYSPVSIAIARALESSDKGVRELFTQYNSVAAAPARGQLDMMENRLIPKEQILQSMGIVPQEQQNTTQNENTTPPSVQPGTQTIAKPITKPKREDTGQELQITDLIASADTPQQKHRAVSEYVAQLNELSGANAVVFSEISELPETLQLYLNPTRFEAYGITYNNVSYICAPLMADMLKTLDTYIHEVAGHKNVEAAIKFSEQKPFYEAVVDDIGIDAMLNLNISELSEEVERFKIGENAKKELGREYVAYLTSKYFTSEDFNKTSEDFFVDLSNPLTDEIIGQVLISTNNGKGKIGIIPRRTTWVRSISSAGRLKPSTDTEIDKRRHYATSDIALSAPTNGGRMGNEDVNTGWVDEKRSVNDSMEEDTGTLSEQEPRGVDRDKQTDSPADAPKSRIGENNTIVPADRIEELRKRAKEKLSQLNSGFDPELFAIFTELSAGYIEAGVRKFADFTTNMVAEFGEVVKPYLAAMYEGARRLPGMEEISKEMDSTIYVDNYLHNRQITKKNGTPRKRNIHRGTSNTDGSGVSNMAGGESMGLFSPSLQVGQPESVSQRESRPDVRPERGVDARRDGEIRGSNGSNTDELSELGRGELRLGQPADGRPVEGDEGAYPVSRRRTDRNVRNFRITDVSKALAPKGEVSKIKANIEAIKLMKTLKSEGGQATDDEKAILSQYSGWGGLATVLDRRSTVSVAWDVKYKKYNDELRELLTPEEFTAAVNSTISAHYTSPKIISAIWDAVKRMGFKGGSIMEPAMGIGNFFGVMPAEISANSKLIGYELDNITGGIAQLLYPDAGIKVSGYETAIEQNGSMDLVVTNVPFGKTAPYDPRNKDISSFSLHNYFIAKGLRQLKDGGIGVFVTSSSTMDSRSSTKFREWTTRDGNADFIGAIRLPNTAFEANAGTTVTTDILFYRKRDGVSISKNAHSYSGLEIVRQVEHQERKFNNQTRKWELPVVSMQINEYYAENPEMMLGDMKFAFEVGKGGLYSDTDQTLQPRHGADLVAELDSAMLSLPADIYSNETAVQGSYSTINSSEEDVVSTFVNRDGKVYEVSEDGLMPITGKVKVDGNDVEKADVISEFVSIKAGARNLIDLEQNSDDEVNIEKARAELKKNYDVFKGKYGTMNKNRSLNFLQDDIQHLIAYSLENVESYYEKSKSGRDVKKYNVSDGDILTKRINHPVEIPTSADSVDDAVNLSKRHKGSIDIDFIAGLMGLDAPSAEIEILNSGAAFINPTDGKLEERTEYLSGYVKDKLEIAKEYAKIDAKYEANIKELERVIPKDILPSDVNFRLGSYWMPAQYIKDFYKDQFGAEPYTLIYSAPLGEWVVRTGYSSKDQVVRGYNSSELATKVLNQRSVVVYDKVGDKNVKNIEATAEVAAKMAEINDAFIEYIHGREDAMQEIAKLYNEKFNNYANREYKTDSGYYPGANRDIKLRPHQSNAVQRMLNDSVLLAHEVGTGKTFTMITGVMEMRRLGIANKPMIVVQNSTLEQFSTSFQQLYPSAKLLVPSENQRSAAGRQRTFAMIAYGDWDAVIIPQSFIDFIEDDTTRVAEKLQKELDSIEDLMDERDMDYSMKKELAKRKKQLEGEIEKSKATPKVKDIARKQLSTEKKFNKQSDRRTDKLFTFEELGVDALIVDEAHAYKKLGFTTNMGNVKGIDTGVSKRAFSMKMKTDWIQAKTGGRNVVFATGTPITNTMAEAWTMMRYVAPDILERYEIENFDAFASAFGVIETSFEFNTAGNFKQVERFKSFMNAPEFINLFKAKTDVVLSKDIPGFAEQLPKLKNGGFTQIIVKRNKQLIDFMEIIKKELNEWGKKPAKERNTAVPLVMFSRATQAAIDLRLVNPEAIDDPGSKANAVVNNAKRIYDETSSYNGTQMIFIDRYMSPDYSEISGNYSVYRNPQTTKRFNLYEDMRDKLVAMGVPASEIAIVTEMDAKKKEQLFDKVNSGDVRIILGSTERMGVGVNAQRLMAAVHHVDAPARPMDFTQRNGRIIRQGNMHSRMGKDVQVLTYGVEKTLDVTAYQRLTFKQAFIEQVLRGDIDSRMIEDAADEGSLSGQSFEEMMGNLSGSQYALRLTDLKAQLSKAELGSKNYERSRSEIRMQVNMLSQRVIPLKMNIEKKSNAAELVHKLFPDGKVTSVSIGNNTYTDKISEALQKEFDQFAAAYSRNRNTDPLRIKVNSNDRPAVVMYDSHNEKFSYIMRIGEDEIKGELTTGGGFMTSVSSRIKSIQSDIIKLQAELKDVEESIPSYEKRLSEPNKSAVKVVQLQEEIKNITELMSKESEDEEKRVAQELEKAAQEDSEIRMRDLDEINGTFNSELQQLIDGSLGTGHVFSLGMPSEALLLSGVPELPIELSATRLKAKSEQENHKFDLGNVVNLPDAIANPIAVFDSTKGGASKVILTELSNGKDNFVVVLNVHNKGRGRNNIEVNDIVSLYPKDHFQGIADWINSGLMRWVNKEKASEFISVQWPNYIGNGDKIKGSNSVTKVIENFENPTFEIRNHGNDISLKELETQHEYEQNKERKYTSPDKRKAQVVEQLQKLSKEFHTEVVVVDSVRELPDNLRYSTRGKQFSGFYHKPSSKVYFVASVIRDADDATAAFLHEVVSHKGIDGLMGKEKANEFYAAVFDNLKADEQSQLLAKYGNKVIAGDEAVARMAEGDVIPSTMQRIIAAVRRFFREVLGIPLTISDNDIRYILWKSKNNLQQAKTVEQVISVVQRDKALQNKLYPKPKSLMDQIDEVAIRYRDAEQPPRNEVDTTKFRVSGKKNSLSSNAIQVQEALQDSTIKVKLLQDEVKKRGGSIDMFTNEYESLNHRDSRADAAMQKYTRTHIEPFVKFVSGLKDITYNDASDYMLAKHSLERDASGISALDKDIDGKWTKENAQKLVADFENKVSEQELNKLWSMWRKATNEILEIAVQSGRMSHEERNAILGKEWTHYVPLRGKDFDFEGTQDIREVFHYDRTGRGSSGSNPSKEIVAIKALGRASKAEDPISTLQNMAHLEIYMGEVNKSHIPLLRLAQKYPEMTDLFQMRERWYVKYGQEWKPSDTKPDKSEIEASVAARKAIKKYEEQLSEKLKEDMIPELKEFVIEGLREKIEQERNNITVTRRELEARGYTGAPESINNVIIMRDGVKYVVRLDDAEVAQAINNRSGSVQSWMSRYPGRVTRVMSQLATSKNPAFLFPNFLRDLQHATLYNWVDSDGNTKDFLKYATVSWKTLHRNIRGTANPLTQSEIGTLNLYNKTEREILVQKYGKNRVNDTFYDLFVMNGGETGYVHILDPKEYQQKLKKEIATMTGKGALNGTKQGWKAINNGIDYMANMSENAVRYATFMSQIDNGSNVFDAVTYAKNITVNFNRKGKYSKGIGGLFMFFNAGVQGAQNGYSLWGNKKGKSTEEITKQRGRFIFANAVLATVGYFAAAFLYEMLQGLVGDDGEEFQISDYERRTNLIVPMPGTEKGYIKMPIPILFRPFYSLGVMTNDWVNGRVDTRDVMAASFGNIFDAVSPLQVSYDINSDNFIGSVSKSMIPSAIKPWTDVLMYNHDFAGRKINKESPYSPNTPDSELGQANANKLAISISKWFNKLGGGNEFTPAGIDEHGQKNALNWMDISPSTIEHFVTQYTGGIGKIINETIVTLTADSVDVRKIPIANRFIGQVYEKDPSKEYYDIKSNVEWMERNIRQSEEKGVENALFPAEELPEKKQYYKEQRTKLRQTERRIGDIKKQLEGVQFGSDEYDALESQIDRLQREFIKEYRTDDKRN